MDGEEFRAAARAWLAANAGDAPRDYGAILPPDLYDEGVAWHRRLFADGWAGIHWPEEFGGRGLTHEHQGIWLEECARAGVPPLLNMVGLVLAGGAILLLRHTRAAGALPAPDGHGRPRVVPALQRARRGQRPGRADARAPSATASASWSTARRCGARAVATATGAS